MSAGKFTYSVPGADGSRKSDRVYTHAVVADVSREFEGLINMPRDIEHARKHARENWRWIASIHGGERFHHYSGGMVLPIDERHVVAALADYARCAGNPDNYADEAEARVRAEYAPRLVEPDHRTVLSYHGSARLALSGVKDWMRAHYTRVVVEPVVCVEKAPKPPKEPA